jgi:hypothetical protein
MCTTYISILLGYEAVSLLKLFQILRKKVFSKIFEVLSTLVEGVVPLENEENILSCGNVISEEKGVHSQTFVKNSRP